MHAAHESGRAPRVVITGIGLCTGLGGRDETWQAIRSGRSALRFLEQIPVEPGTPRYAGAPAEARAIDNAGVAASMAMRDAAILQRGTSRLLPTLAPERVATLIGSSKGEVKLLGALCESRSKGPLELWLTLMADWNLTWPAYAAEIIARKYGLEGPLLTPVAACATGLIAAIQGAALIRRGDCDVALVGAADTSLEPVILGAFRRMGVMAKVDGEPGRAVRPWDRGRSGFLVGEGAGVLVLERDDHAQSRGVLSYGELAGGALGSDAFHITQLNPDAANLAGLIGRALRFADVDPSEIDHVNLHGSATAVSDPLECQALKMALGEHARHVSCSANKPQIGHCLGAAGAIELALTCLAVRDGFVPPTLNLDDPDPLCDLDATPHVGRTRPIRAALKLSLGFGGHLAAAVVRQVEAPRRAAVPT